MKDFFCTIFTSDGFFEGSYGGIVGMPSRPAGERFFFFFCKPLKEVM